MKHIVDAILRKIGLRYNWQTDFKDNMPENSERFLLVGLGNPGRKYRGNRHNIGFMAVDELARKYGIESKKVQNKAIMGLGRIQNKSVIIAKPQTYMNNSGDAVGPLANYYKIPNEHILIIYDELDLPYGTIRLREKGGAGGHKGMRSIINHLGQNFARMRLGIGRPPGQMPVQAYVLQDFKKDELHLLTEILTTAVQAAEMFLTDGIQLAMSRFNGTVNGINEK